MQCQTDAIRFCTCELCGALETPRNSPDLSLGEQFFTVIVQVIALVVGKKKKNNHKASLCEGGISPVLWPQGYMLRMETDFTELIVSKGVNSLHPYMWIEWQLLMVSDACSLQLGIASPEAPSTPAKKG